MPDDIRSCSVRWAIVALAALGVAGGATESRALTVLTTGKVAVSKDRPGTARDVGRFRFGKDPALRPLVDPRCPGESAVQVAFYPQATQRLVARPLAVLPCANWKARGAGYVYNDPAAGQSGVRSILYLPSKLVIKLKGPGFEPVAGPVGYLEVWFTVGDERYLGRFHNFGRNDAAVIVTRKPSTAAARGEAAFWDVLHGNDSSAAREAQCIAALTTATKRAPRDGRSHFLLGMMHLYRFGQATVDYGDVSVFARQEIDAAHRAFQAAVPLLWDGASGDSRVPGFAAAAKYAKAVVDDDAPLQAEAVEDLNEAVAINQFFNVFDLIPIAQAAPAGDPLFQAVFAEVDAYLNAPGTLACVQSQPEICANDGLAPHNAEGALVLFGDLYAKAGDLGQAQLFYALARLSVQPGTWQFQAVLDDRVANAATRVALYQDADPANDPPIVGAGPEACAVCHYE